MANLGGRPPVYETPEDMSNAISNYFEYVKGEFEWVTTSDEEGKPCDVKRWIREPEAVTITGLCLYLGFESRQSFYDNEKRDGFSYIIRRARMMVENHYEVTGQVAKTPTFQIFALKNMGWADKTEVDNKSSDGSMTPKSTTIVFTKSDE